MEIPCNGVLLIGPTGCGKTPLGELMAVEGLRGRRAAHFDFGEHLRRAVASAADYPLLSFEEIEIISNSLKTGALLTDDQFTIAEKLLLSYVRANGMTSSDRLILNGMPRHVGQAEKVCNIIEMSFVVSLQCDDETVLARIATNAGRDRANRVDDQREAVLRKLAIFKEQTVPLVSYYEDRYFPVERVNITLSSTPREILRQLNASFY